MGSLSVRRDIDAYKLFVSIWMIGILFYYRQWENVAALSLTLAFASYGSMWLVKSNLFPDRQWETNIPFPKAILVLWVPLLGYLAAPTVMMSRGATLAPWIIALFLFAYIWGVFLHFVSDSHKHFVMRARPGLVVDGLWGLSRNVNYAGELLIYLAFVGIPAAALRSALPLVPLLWSICVIWLPGMRNKDSSHLSRYPEFAAWKQKTAFWLPFLW